MTKKFRRQHSPQFKLDAVALVLDQGYTHAEAAEAMGEDISSIRRWTQQLKIERGGQTPTGKPLTAEQQKIQTLKKGRPDSPASRYEGVISHGELVRYDS